MMPRSSTKYGCAQFGFAETGAVGVSCVAVVVAFAAAGLVAAAPHVDGAEPALG